MITEMMAERLLYGTLAVLAVVFVLLVFRKAVKMLLGVILRSVLGLFALAVGQAAGLTLGVNVVNALILGVLGLPGFGLLLLVQWTLRL